MSLKKIFTFYPGEYKALLRLGVPITIGQVGYTLQGLVDNIMVGRHSSNELAAAGFVNSLFVLALLLCLGFSFAAVSQIGARYAQGKHAEIASLLKSSLVADVLQSLVITLCMGGVYWGLGHMGQPEELLPLMRPYFLILLLSIPFMGVCNAYRQVFDSVNDTHVSMTIMLLGNVWNIFFNWLLIYGKWGFPEMGVAGAAWATTTSRMMMMLCSMAVFHGWSKYRPYSSCMREAKASLKEVLLLNRLGWPIAVQSGMEAASFSLVAIPLGWLGAEALAAHQIMVSVSLTIFMFYVGIGSAVSIRVSNFHGLGNGEGIQHAAYSGYQMILAVGVVMSALVFSFRYEVASIFTDNEGVWAVVSSMCVPLMLYQLGDGMQTNFVNVLRGMGDVKKLMQYSFVAYMVISLPLSVLFGITLHWGAPGIWMGFPFGLTTAGVLYLRRFHYTMRHYHLSD